MTNDPRRLRLTTGVMLTVALLTTGVATSTAQGVSAPDWGPVKTLAHGNVSRPDVVAGPGGAATAVWRKDGWVVATRRPAEGSWGPRVRLGRGTAPQIGIDRTGTTTVIWTRTLNGFGPQVMASRRTPSGAWSTPVAVTPKVPSQPPTRHGAFEPVLAVGNDGGLVVTWLREPDDSGTSRVQARYRAADGTWEPIATLGPVESRSPTAAAANNGRAVVVYTLGARAYAVRHRASGWTGRRLIGRHVEPPQVAMDDAGDIVVAWSALQDDGFFRPEAVTREVGGPWSDPVTLDASTFDPPAAPEPVVGTGPSGLSTAAWARPNGEVVSSDRPLGGAWTAPEQVAPAGDTVIAAPPYLDLTVGRSGARLLAWTRRAGPDRYVEAAYRPASGGWLTPTRTSPVPVRAAAPEGWVYGGDRALLVWRGVTPDDNGRVQVRRLGP